MIFIKNTLLISFVFILISCSSSEEKIEQTISERLSEEEIYDSAQGHMADKNYTQAVKEFLDLERQYPFSPLATKSQILAAYAHYKDQEYDDAIAIIDRFIKLHPGNKYVSYAFYLKALCYYERIADVKRDQNMTKKALEALNDVIIRFEDSDYAKDASLKLDLVKDHLAGKEMEIGRFYQKKRQYIASINRFKTVVEKHDTTSHVPEALYRLSELYLTLGVEKEARRYASVLGYNFPDSKWYKYAYRITAGGAESPKPIDEKTWVPDWLIFDENTEELSLPPSGEKSDDGWFGNFINTF